MAGKKRTRKLKGKRVLAVLFVIFILSLIGIMLVFFRPMSYFLTGNVIREGPYKTDKLDEIEKSVSVEEHSETDFISGIELNTSVKQYGAVLGKPVKWNKKVALSDATPLVIKIPANADNIKILNKKQGKSKTIQKNMTGENNLTLEINVSDSAVSNQTDGNKTKKQSNETNVNETALGNETVIGNETTAGNGGVVNETAIKEKSKTDKITSTEDNASIAAESSSSLENESTETSIIDTPSAVMQVITRFLLRELRGVFYLGPVTIKGHVVVEDDAVLTEDFFVDEDVEEVELEYYTDAPYAVETPSDEGKEVKIVGPEDIHYENVLAFSELNEEWGITDKEVVKIYWKENSEFIEGDIYDIDGNGIYDYIEWVVPSLSNQTFEIIIITKAQHLDKDKLFLKDIYNEVREQDNLWSETILDSEYIRVTFERNLTSGNDITVYPRVASGSPIIEVHERDGSEIIAQFDSLENNEYNRVLLSNLIGEQDSFDLRIVGGEVEFDHIIDPVEGAPAGGSISYVDPTPANGSTQSYNSIFVNVSSNDSNDHYTFLDFDKSLVLWMRMDDVNGNGDPTDLSRYSNNGSAVGGAVQNTTDGSGRFGRAFVFGGSGDYVNLSDINAIDSASELTISAWVYHNSLISDDAILTKGTSSNADGLLLWRDDLAFGSGRTDTYTFFVGDSSDADNTRLEGATNAAF